jgi:hypothetical protein
MKILNKLHLGEGGGGLVDEVEESLPIPFLSILKSEKPNCTYSFE